MALRDDIFRSISQKIDEADRKYGSLASSHEGIGVALEEWNELCHAVHKNSPEEVLGECLDLAAVIIRMFEHISTNPTTLTRSFK